MTFSAEQRRGKQGENDTRLPSILPGNPAAQCRNSLTRMKSLHGVALQAAVMIWWIATTTSFWNIAKRTGRLTLTDPVTGKSGEVKSLVSSLQTKYALKGYNVEATALEAAGGKVVTTGKDILVTLPAYRFTSTPETDNTGRLKSPLKMSKAIFRIVNRAWWSFRHLR